MKKIFFIFISFIVLTQNIAKAEVAMIGVVSGMVCMECQKKVEAALTEKAGTKATVDVSWPENVAVVSFEGTTNLTEADFKNVVEGVGFTTGKIVKVDEENNARIRFQQLKSREKGLREVVSELEKTLKTEQQTLQKTTKEQKQAIEQ